MKQNQPTKEAKGVEEGRTFGGEDGHGHEELDGCVEGLPSWWPIREVT